MQPTEGANHSLHFVILIISVVPVCDLHSQCVCFKGEASKTGRERESHCMFGEIKSRLDSRWEVEPEVKNEAPLSSVNVCNSPGPTVCLLPAGQRSASAHELGAPWRVPPCHMPIRTG